MRTRQRILSSFNPFTVLLLLAVVMALAAGPVAAQDAALAISWDHPANGASMCTTALATGWVVIGGSGARTGTLTIDGAKVLDHDAGPAPDKKEGSYFWNASAQAPGTHTFVVAISDATGATASDTLTINLANPAPVITSPASGATVSGTVPVTISSDDKCASHDFTVLVDGVVVDSVSAGAAVIATIEWNTGTWSNGAHQLTAQVTGNGITNSTTIPVTVENNGGDTTAPTVAITSPQNGDWTGNSIDVTATATDNAGLATLKFFGNGTRFAQVSCGNAKTCSATEWWLTGSLPSGKHTITVVATDTAGNQTTSAPVVINK